MFERWKLVFKRTCKEWHERSNPVIVDGDGLIVTRQGWLDEFHCERNEVSRG